ncbi:MAG: sulfite exporter TauE/SafE family protein [Ruminococcaceae bacterium]|nr:sulfite exporter TauE/SafE family protein [Oscillospiraceae bacterium]
MLLKTALAGAAAGLVNGLFGAGGGMILVPLLSFLTELEDQEVFPASVSIMLPMCVVSLAVSSMGRGLPWADALPYLIGSALGGILAGLWGRKIPTVWLHRGLGLLILWGGVQYLWP